jgi:hypothetical protein
VPVHGGLTAVALGGAHRSTSHRCYRAQELTAEGAKGGGHSDDPYRLHRQAVDGRRWARGEEDKWAVVVLDGKCSVVRNEGGCQDWMRGEWLRSRAPFIELRRQVEVTRKRRRSAGGGLSMLNGFKAKEEEGEIGRHQFGGGIEGHEMPVQFICLCTEESCRWRCMARRKLGRPRR